MFVVHVLLLLSFNPMALGTLWGTNFFAELPTRSRDLLVGSWGAFASVAGESDLESILGTQYAYLPHIINYKILGSLRTWTNSRMMLIIIFYSAILATLCPPVTTTRLVRTVLPLR